MSQAPPKTLMIFVDGLGMGAADPRTNPLCRGDCPLFFKMLCEHGLPVDATLGMSGTPQSATGQATLFCGENAAAFMGRHVEGFPGPQLKGFVRNNNLFDKLRYRGFSSTFANGYFCEDFAEIRKLRRQSVTTVAALKAFGRVRDSAALLRNKAVYHDITRRTLSERGYRGPVIQPQEAARHLLRVAAHYHFTLFEYFLTDIVAHRGTPEDKQEVLRELDAFFSIAFAAWVKAGGLFLLTSDHGNLEDNTTRGHTMNPVPFVAVGPGAETVRKRVRSLTDVAPALIDFYAKNND